MRKKKKPRPEPRRKKPGAKSRLKPEPGIPEILRGAILIEDAEWEKAFFDLLDQHWGNMSGALKQAGVYRRNFYYALDKNPEFAKRLYEFREKLIDRCEDLIVKRATIGEDHRIYYMGKVIDVQKVPDNNLLLSLIKSRKPEYRTTNLEVKGKVDVSEIMVVYHKIDQAWQDAVTEDERLNRLCHQLLEIMESKPKLLERIESLHHEASMIAGGGKATEEDKDEDGADVL